MAERVILIENRCKISFSNFYVVIEKEGVSLKYHIDDFDTVLFSALDLSCSLYTLVKLCENGKLIIFCDGKKLPYSGMIPLYGTQNAFSRFKEQIAWTTERKDYVWQEIVIRKLQIQNDVLKFFNCHENTLPQVEFGDSTNAEGRFADKYFHELFGFGFIRHERDNINAALNYGYSILLSATARIVALHGFNQTLGIHHIGDNNNFNLACDIMEPFRPVVDVVVKRNGDKELNTEYKKDLISVLYKNIEYKGKRYSLKTAIELFFIDVIKYFNGENDNLGELRLKTLDE